MILALGRRRRACALNHSSEQVNISQYPRLHKPVTCVSVSVILHVPPEGDDEHQTPATRLSLPPGESSHRGFYTADAYSFVTVKL